MGHSLLCRLKVVGAYYSEFKEDVLALADGAAAAGAHPEAAAGDSAQPAAAAPTAAALSAVAIRSRVEAAVAAVMGAVPAATEPLVEAGLDSLGGCLPPPSASVAEWREEDRFQMSIHSLALCIVCILGHNTHRQNRHARHVPSMWLIRTPHDPACNVCTIPG